LHNEQVNLEYLSKFWDSANGSDKAEYSRIKWKLIQCWWVSKGNIENLLT